MPNIVLAVLFIAISFNVQAKTKTFASGAEQNALIELYTSEGCSSCPPADTWLSTLKNHPQLWSSFVPVAFHVDYWDYIGWKDRFASNHFSLRQQHYQEKGLSRSVYTPGFFINGQEWRGFFRQRNIEVNNKKTVGRLKVNIQDSKVHASFSPRSNSNQQTFKLNIALLGFNLFSRVDNGENQGRLLQHDFVVLVLKDMLMQLKDGGYAATMELALPTNAETQELGFAAWVTNLDSPVPIQSVGGFLD